MDIFDIIIINYEIKKICFGETSDYIIKSSSYYEIRINIVYKYQWYVPSYQIKLKDYVINRYFATIIIYQCNKRFTSSAFYLQQSNQMQLIIVTSAKRIKNNFRCFKYLNDIQFTFIIHWMSWDRICESFTFFQLQLLKGIFNKSCR